MEVTEISLTLTNEECFFVLNFVGVTSDNYYDEGDDANNNGHFDDACRKVVQQFQIVKKIKLPRKFVIIVLKDKTQISKYCKEQIGPAHYFISKKREETSNG